MKRLMLLICALLLLTGTALADFDFTPYELQGHYACQPLIMLDDHTVIGMSQSHVDDYSSEPVLYYLTCWRDGQPISEVQLPEYIRPEGVVLQEDGVPGWLWLDRRWEYDDPDGPHLDKLHMFTLTEGYYGIDRMLSDSVQYFAPAGVGQNRFMYVEKLNGENWVTIADGNGEAMQHFAMNFRSFSQNALPVRFIMNDDGSFWVLIRSNSQEYLYLHRDGQWQSIATVDGYPGISSDGKGGVFMSQSVGQSTYKPVQLTHYDANGKKLGEKGIKGDNVLIGFSIRYDPETNHYELFGSAVANSRKVYLTWYVLCDDQLTPISDFDVREFNYHGNYSFSSIFSPSGKRYLFGIGTYDGSQSHPVLVPFDVLPKAKNPGLTIW